MTELVDQFVEAEAPAEAEAPVEENTVEEIEVEKPEPEKKVEPKSEKYVPHAALHEERLKRKELQAKVDEMERRHAEFERQKQQPRVEEDEYADPVEKVERSQKELIAYLKAQETQKYQQIQEAQKHQDFVKKYTSVTQEYAKENPDFKDAYQHLIQARREELQVAGYSGEELDKEMYWNERNIVERAWNSDQSVGEVIYKLAQQRGFKKPDNADKIDSLDKGASASKTLGGGGAESKKDEAEEFSIDVFKPSSDFDKSWADYEKKYRRASS